MADNPRVRTHHALRWPTLDRAIVGGDPATDMPEPGDLVVIDGVRYRVREARSIKQFEIIVETDPPQSGHILNRKAPGVL